MKIGLGIAELWVNKLGWGQIPFSQNYGEYDKHNQYWIFNHLFRFVESLTMMLTWCQQHQLSPTCSSQTTTNKSPYTKNTQWISAYSAHGHASLPVWKGCHSIHQMVNLTNVAKMEFDPTPTYRPITPRYLIRFSSFKIWWHDNMLTYAHTKYWIHPITSY